MLLTGVLLIEPVADPAGTHLAAGLYLHDVMPITAGRILRALAPCLAVLQGIIIGPGKAALPDLIRYLVHNKLGCAVCRLQYSSP